MVSFNFDYSSATKDFRSFTVIVEDNLSILRGISDFSTLDSNKTNFQYIYDSVSSIEMRWINVKAAMSYDHGKFYQNIEFAKDQNTVSKTTTNNILLNQTIVKSPNVYQTNFAFKKIYRSTDEETIRILNASLVAGTDKHVYIKNLIVLRDYLEVEFKIQYYNFDTTNFSENDYPEVALFLGFDEFNYTFPYSVSGYTREFGVNSSKTITLTATTATPTFKCPTNFLRLETLPKNKKFVTADLNTTTNLTTTGSMLAAFDDNKAFVCTGSNFLNYQSSGSFSCDSSCLNSISPKYITYPGVYWNSKGRCNYQCSSSMSCDTSSSSLSNISAAGSFTCVNGTYLNEFYTCPILSNVKDSYFYYSSKYTPGNIEIKHFSGAVPTLSSYIIELWFLPDKFHPSTQLYLNPSYKNYVFYSNCCRIYYNDSGNEYFVEYSYSGLNYSINTQFNHYEWNRIVFSVYFDPTSNNYSIDLYLNYNSTAVITTKTTNINQDLTYIVFCHLESNNCQSTGGTIYWSSGLYKNLRVWDLSYSEYSQTQQWSIFYPEADTANFPKGLYSYYPLTIQYITYNILDDITTNNNDVNVNTVYSSINVDNLQLYNYSAEFDIINYAYPGKFMSNYDVTNYNYAATNNNCFTGCRRCWGSNPNQCYECNSGRVLYNKECVVASNYVFRSPTTSTITFTSPTLSLSPKGTITFWSKPFGFSLAVDADMFYFSNNLKLAYDSTNEGTNTEFGLNVYSIVSGTTTSLITASNFRNYTGVWGHYSLAYYYSFSNNSFFPAMMNFSINGVQYSLKTGVNINGLSISTLKIPTSYFGLFVNLKAYNNYLVETYSIDTSNITGFTPLATYLIPSSTNTGCFVSSNTDYLGSYTCVEDYDEYLETSLKCASNTTYMVKTATIGNVNCPSCNATCPKGCYNVTTNGNSEQNTCFCNATDIGTNYYPHFMLLSNSNAFICKNYDYYNFSKVNKLTFNTTANASPTKTYALQFWIYTYDYVAGTFGGMSIIWDYHMRINVKSTGTNTYQFQCIPVYVNNGSYDSLSVTGNTLTYTNRQWNYVSCSADLTTTTYYYYLLTETLDNGTNTTFSASAPNLSGLTTVNLIIKDNTTTDDWGVMFIKQIRLWLEVFPNKGFLSRVNIVTPTLFSTLVGLIDSNYNSNLTLTDSTGNSSSSLNLTYSGTIGRNVVDDTSYSTLFLCSENTNYYDSITGTCISFANLANFQDLSFPGIPSSYFGAYTLEFWVFSESQKDMTDGINIIYSNHIGVSIITNSSSTLSAICFPQAYRDSIDGLYGTNVYNVYDEAVNSREHVVSTMPGTWSWIRCAVSSYEQVYYISDDTIQELKGELLYQVGSTNYHEYRPYHYFFSNNTATTIKLQNMTRQTKKVYIRNIYAFNDYLPKNYAFKNLNLKNIASTNFPSLVFVCDFSELAGTSLKYRVFDYPTTAAASTLTVTVLSNVTNAFAANFSALNLCDPTLGSYYDDTTENCVNASCLPSLLNANYCYLVGFPLQCTTNNYIQALTLSNMVCNNTCPSDTTRAPGSEIKKGICNFNCDTTKTSSCPSSSGIQDFPNNFTCTVGTYHRNDYYCIEDSKKDLTALYYSRCFNMPNFYINFSAATISSLSNGYLIEFWFKVDLANSKSNTTNCQSIATNEYYLYLIPHSIYKTTTGDFKYQIVNYTTYSATLNEISKYEWNIVIIKTIKTAGVQSVDVYVNYNFTTPAYSNSNVPISINMNISSLAFCAKSSNGNCSPNGTSPTINWGSAYYRNLRVWDSLNASEQTIQALNNGFFTETLQSLKIYYPFTSDKSDINVITNIISSSDNINVNSIYTGTSNESSDKTSLYNVSQFFDYIDYQNQQGSYVTNINLTTGVSYGQLTISNCNPSCARCYSTSSTDCYECASGYILREKECVEITNYYLKVPSNSNTPAFVPLIFSSSSAPIYDLTSSSTYGVTLTFWFKFLGVPSSVTNAQPVILRINNNAYFCYHISTQTLRFVHNLPAFIDTTYNKKFGNWVFISFSTYRSNIYTYYPNMLSVSVDYKEIPIETSYTPATNGISISMVSLGYEVSGMFYNIRYYNTFMIGSFGRVLSDSSLNSINFLYGISASSANDSSCISNSDLNGTTNTILGLSCKPDYNMFDDVNMMCNDNTKFLDTSSTNSPPCEDCDLTCVSSCYGALNSQCSCDLKEGKFWVRKNASTSELYCDPVKNIDFLSFNDISITSANIPVDEVKYIKSTNTDEYTMDFWVYIYSYVTTTLSFKSYSIIWDFHSRVKLYNKLNSLYVDCYVTNDYSDLTLYSQKLSKLLSFNAWNYIKCGTNKKESYYFLNDVRDDISITLPEIPKMTDFYMQHDSAAFVNWGFIYIRNLNLWRQANYNYITTKYIDISPNANYYPGLLHSFKNNFNNSTMVDQTNGKLFTLTRRTDFVGYNIVDPNNLSLYSDLLLCLEGQVYDSSTLSCVTTTVSYCEYLGNLAGDCMKCEDVEKYIFPYSGKCFTNCPDYYYNNDYINQCRLCNETCNTCNGPTSDNCTSCNETYSFVPDRNLCTETCELFNLTKGLNDANLCVLFDASAVLIYPDLSLFVGQDYKKFNPKTFDSLIANVTECTAAEYETLWILNEEETQLLNTDNGGVLFNTTSSGSPFLSNVSLQEVELDVDFFQYGKKYFFDFNVSTTFDNETTVKNMTVNFNWTFEMANVPLNGKLEVMPNIGFKNTTYFIWSCDGFKADTKDELLDYKMTYLEDNTNNEKTILDWTNSTLIENATTIMPTFFSLEYVNVTFICYARDSNEAVSNVTYSVKVVNDADSKMYSINIALDDYFNFDLEYSDYRAYLKSIFLYSLVQDTIKSVSPSTVLTTVKPSSDGTQFLLTDPTCIKTFCNSNGNCEIIDFWMICNCDSGYIGLRCQITKESYTNLNKAYKDLLDEVVNKLGTSINTEKMETIENIIVGASLFEQDDDIFTNSFEDFMSILRNSDPYSTINNTEIINNMLNSIYTYEMETMNKLKAVNKKLTDYPYRNITLDISQIATTQTSVFSIIDKINTFIDYYVKIKKGTTINLSYTGTYFSYSIKSLTAAFSASTAYSSEISNYEPYVDPSKCISNFEVTNNANPYFTDAISFVNYKLNPFAYDYQVYQDTVATYIEIKVFDSSSGDELNISGCKDTPINIYFPLHVYGYYLEKINEQVKFYNSSNYLSPDDPIFHDPIYINASGYVSNDTVEERIEKYKRKFNLSAKYYSELTEKFTNSGITYDTLTDKYYFRFNSSHLTGFSVFAYENDVTFTVAGPFFYLTRPEVLLWSGNYSSNYAFFIMIALLSYYFLIIFISLFWDYKFLRQEVLLRFITKQIVENQIAYNQSEKESSDDLPKVNVYDNHDDNEQPPNYLDDKSSTNRVHLEDNTAAPVNKKQINSISTFKGKHMSPLEMDMMEDLDMKHKLGEQDKNFVSPNDLMNLDNIDEFHLDNLSINDKDDAYGKSAYPENVKMNNLLYGADKVSAINHDYVSNNPIIYGDVININEKEIKKMEEGPRETDPKEEEDDRLRAFHDINLSACQFFCWNLRRRHVVLNSITYLSAFHSRYMKLTMFVSQNSVYMLLLSIFLTSNQTIVIVFSPNFKMVKIVNLILYCFVCMIAASLVNYILSCGFIFSRENRRKLYKVVRSGKKMRILKYWNDMTGCLRCMRVSLTMFIHITIWLVSFYISFIFNAVWTNMNYPWLVGYLFCFFFDVIIFELLIEGIIAFIFSFRKHHSSLK